jgi:tRNA-Thr(GGU) m(6)t(6)A37 methyltransferase TsaA
MPAMPGPMELTPIGIVSSPLTDPALAPRQGDEGSPDAVIVCDPAFAPGLSAIRVGDEILVLTWLHLARRDVLEVHPRGDLSRPREGVFSTRSPDRPNPLGLHRVTVTSVDGPRIGVRDLEAVAGTPVVDIKPVLSDELAER